MSDTQEQQAPTVSDAYQQSNDDAIQYQQALGDYIKTGLYDNKRLTVDNYHDFKAFNTSAQGGALKVDREDPYYVYRAYKEELNTIKHDTADENQVNLGLLISNGIISTNEDFGPESITIKQEYEDTIKQLNLDPNNISDEQKGLILQSALYSAYSKNLKGKPLPDTFFNTEYVKNLKPDARVAIALHNHSMKVLNGLYDKYRDIGVFSAGASEVEELNQLDELKANGGVDDLTYLRSYLDIKEKYKQDGFWAGLGAGFAGDMYSFKLGYDKYGQEHSIDPRFKDSEAELHNSFKNAGLLGQTMQDNTSAAAQEAAFSIVHNASLVAATKENVDEVANIYMKNPSKSVEFYLKETENSKQLRAWLYTGLNLMTFVPLPVGTVAKGVGTGLSTLNKLGLRIAKGASSKVITGPLGYVYNPMAKAARAMAAKSLVSKFAGANAIKLNTAGKLGVALVANTLDDAVMQSTGDAAVAYSYQDDKNRLLDIDDSKIGAAADKFLESFVGNVAMGVALGAGGTIATFAKLNKDINHHNARLNELKLQQDETEKAIQKGATVEDIRTLSPVRYEKVVIDGDGICDEALKNPVINEELSKLAKTQGPAQELALELHESILADMGDNAEIGEKINRGSSRVAFTVDAVELAALTSQSEVLKKLFTKHSKLTETDLTINELAGYESEIARKVQELAQNEDMFKDGYYEFYGADKRSDPELMAIESELNKRMIIPEGAQKDFNHKEIRNTARFFAPAIANFFYNFAKESNIPVRKLFDEVNLRFAVAGKTYDLKDGKLQAETMLRKLDDGYVIYLDENFTSSTLVHELAHLHLEMLKASNLPAHKQKVDNIVNEFKKQNNIGDDVNLNNEQWAQLQEAYAYNTMFAMSKDFFNTIDKANEYLDAAEELLKKNPEMNTADVVLSLLEEGVGYPKLERLTSRKLLRADADFVAIMGVDLMRHFGNSRSFDEFKENFKQRYKDVYDNDFVEFNYELMKEYKFLEGSKISAYKGAEVSDEILGLTTDSAELRAIVGDDFVDDLNEFVALNRQSLENDSLDLYRAIHNNAYKSKKDILNAIVNIKIAQSGAIQQGLKDQVTLKNQNEVLDKQHQNLNIKLKKIERLAAARTNVDKSHIKSNKSVIEEYLNEERRNAYFNAEPPDYKGAIVEVAGLIKAEMINCKTQIKTNKQRIRDIEKKVSEKQKKIKKKAETIATDAYENQRNGRIESDNVIGLVDKIHKDVLEDTNVATEGVEFKDTNDFYVNERNKLIEKIRAAFTTIEGLKQTGTKFSEEDILVNSAHSADVVSAFKKAGLIGEPPTTTLHAMAKLKGEGVKGSDILDELRIAIDNPAQHIRQHFDEFSSAQINKSLKDKSGIINHYKEKSLALADRALGAIGVAITKNNGAPHKVSHADEQKLDNMATSIALRASVKVTPYNMQRRATSYVRKAYVALKANNLDKAAKYFANARLALKTAKKISEFRTQIQNRKKTIVRIVSKNSTNKEIKDSYDNHTFMAAKELAYQMGLVQTKRAQEDIVASRTGRETLGLDDNPINRDVVDIDKFSSKDYANMSFAEAVQGVERMSSLLSASRAIARQRKENAAIELEQKINTINALINEKAAIDGIDLESQHHVDVSDVENKKGIINKLKSFKKNMNLSVVRPETILRLIDGTLRHGETKAYDLVYGAVVKSEQQLIATSSTIGKKHVMPLLKGLNQLSKDYKGKLEPYVVEGRRSVVVNGEVLEQKISHTFGASGNIHHEVAVLVANMGTISNRQAMCRALGVDDARLLTIVQELTNRGIITPAMWQLVQRHIWAPYKDVYAQTTKAFNEVNGAFFAKEEGINIKLADGTVVEGGYCPLTVNKRDYENEVVDPATGADAYARSTLPSSDGFTVDRIEHSYDISFTIDDMFHAMQRQLIYAHMAKPCRDAWHLINQPKIKQGVEAIFEGGVKVLERGLLSAMSQKDLELKSGTAQLLSNMAGKTNKAVLAYNFTNALMGLAQISTAIKEVGVVNLTKGVVDFFSQKLRKGPLSRNMIDEASNFMYNRNFTKNKSIDTVIRQYDKRNLFTKSLDFLSRNSFILQSLIQNFSDYVVWSAAYHKQLDIIAGGTKDTKFKRNGINVEAAEYADNVVKRTQLSVSKSNLSEFESKDSAWATALTPFSSVFVSLINLNAVYQAHASKQFAKRSALRKAYERGAIYFWVWILPTVITEYIRGMFMGSDAREAEEDVLWATAASAGYTVHPVAGVLGQYVVKQIESEVRDKPYRTSSGIFSLPIESMIVQSYRGANALFSDEDMTGKDYKDLFTFLALFNEAVYPVTKQVNYWYQKANGELYPTTLGDEIRGALTGTASARQKGEI